MAKTHNELVVNIRPVSLKKKFIQPVAINEKFTSFVCFKHVEIEKTVFTGNKEKSVKEIERAPLMITWDGKEVKWFVCKRGQDVLLGGDHYILDRDIDDSPMLPDEEFIGKLMTREGIKMISDFQPLDLFEEIKSYFERYFYLEKEYLYNILTLFVVNCWVFDAHESTPYLFIRSPMRGCGKTHLGESITWMCNGQMNINFKAHHLFRIVHGSKTIPAFDEIKTWTDAGYKMSDETKDIISLVNVGFQKGGSKVPRLVEAQGGQKGEMKTILYESFSPKIMITTTGVLPTDTASRCIELMLQRAPTKGIDFGDRWYEPDRKVRLRKIREMGLLFRLKYGKEISDVSENVNWRHELDLAEVFSDLRNRELEIFRPLVILCLRYMPKWKELINIYIRKYIDMRNKLEPTPVNNVLWAMRSLYNEVANSSFKEVDFGDKGAVSLIEDPVEGMVVEMPPSVIEMRIEQQTALALFGKNAPSAIGKILNDLGFVTGKKRTSKGIVRIVKVKQLADMIDRYLGMKLSDREDNDDTGGLDQSQRIELLRDIFIRTEKDMTYNEVLAETNGKITEDQLKWVLKHFINIGKLQQFGKVYQWME